MMHYRSVVATARLAGLQFSDKQRIALSAIRFSGSQTASLHP
jgi:hypothetical protein